MQTFIGQPIETAPKDGTWIQAVIPGHGSNNIITWNSNILDEQGNETGGWMFTTDQEPPSCWTDGICWASNENLQPSIQPVSWTYFE